MPNKTRCNRCGQQLPADAPSGQCPACLFNPQAWVNDSTHTAAMGPAVNFVPPTISELQAHFAQFEVLDFLGRGGMGAVYLARQTSLDRLVALKILPPCIGETAGFEDRFVREGRALAKLNHPGIVGVYDFGKVGPFAFLAMEYVDGVNLRSLLAEGHLRPEEALQIVPLLCDALQTAHRYGIVHRDIKPENILLTTEGQVKIADFGVAKMAEPMSGGNAVGHTRHGAIVGTFQYMAPEQIERPGFVDHRADLYSLGVVFYEMLTGELPLGRFPSPSVYSGVDRRIDEIVLKALEKQPELRYGCASQIKTDVQAVGASGFAPRKGLDRLYAGKERIQSWARHTRSWMGQQFWDSSATKPEESAVHQTRVYRFCKLASKRLLGWANGLYRKLERLVKRVTVPVFVAVAGWIALFAGVASALETGIEEEMMLSLGIGSICGYGFWRVGYLMLDKAHTNVLQRVLVIWPLSICAVMLVVAAVLWPIVLGCFFGLGFLFGPKGMRPDWLRGPGDIVSFVTSGTLIASGLNYSMISLIGLFVPEVIQQAMKPFEVRLNSVILLVVLAFSAAVLTLGLFMGWAFIKSTSLLVYL